MAVIQTQTNRLRLKLEASNKINGNEIQIKKKIIIFITIKV